MKRLLAALVVWVLFSPALAGDIEAGAARASMCMTCHGEVGISPNELWPNLAGQKKGYLSKHIQAFKDDHPLITPFMKPLTSAEVENLAVYFSSLKPTL